MKNNAHSYPFLLEELETLLDSFSRTCSPIHSFCVHPFFLSLSHSFVLSFRCLRNVRNPELGRKNGLCSSVIGRDTELQRLPVVYIYHDESFKEMITTASSVYFPAVISGKITTLRLEPVTACIGRRCRKNTPLSLFFGSLIWPRTNYEYSQEKYDFRQISIYSTHVCTEVRALNSKTMIPYQCSVRIFALSILRFFSALSPSLSS